MNENQLKQQANCSHFSLDDWGKCNHQIDWQNDICEGNCNLYKGINYDKLIQGKPLKIISLEEALKDVVPIQLSEDILSGKTKIIVKIK
jgi:hypothetical protein